MTAPAVSVYARGPFQAAAVIILDEDESNHVRVRRANDGDAVRLVDGAGGIATARLAKQGQLFAARVVATTQVPSPPVTEVWVGAGDKDRFFAMVEKATELGATRVVPLLTERSQQVATRFQPVHVEKAVRRAREAIKQCGGAWAPVIVPPVPIAEALRTAGRATRLLADVEGGTLPAMREAEAVQWAVGPEGAFTDAEIAQLVAGGFRKVVLCRSILRYDTAAVAALALCAQARLGSPVTGSSG